MFIATNSVQSLTCVNRSDLLSESCAFEYILIGAAEEWLNVKLSNFPTCRMQTSYNTANRNVNQYSIHGLHIWNGRSGDWNAL